MGGATTVKTVTLESGNTQSSALTYIENTLPRQRSMQDKCFDGPTDQIKHHNLPSLRDQRVINLLSKIKCTVYLTREDRSPQFQYN